MVAYNFISRFAAKVESGEKTQTIRIDRRNGRHASLGSNLQLYTGMRTKHCRKLRDAVCQGTRPIKIEDGNVFVGVFGVPELTVRLSASQIQKLAIADGFESTDEFFEFFPKSKEDRILILWGSIGSPSWLSD